MHLFNRMALLLAVALCATVCQAQKQVSPVLVAKPCCQVKLMVATTGEPVPGAEIYVELEPDDTAKKLPTRIVTDSYGVAQFTVSGSKTVKFTLKLAVAQIGALKKNASAADKAKLVLRVTAGKTVKDHPVEVMLNSTSAVTGGPYSQSLSNIEDN